MAKSLEEIEKRLNTIWTLAPELENQKKFREALRLWREALNLKLKLGITGSGDIGELDGIQKRRTTTEPRARCFALSAREIPQCVILVEGYFRAKLTLL